MLLNCTICHQLDGDIDFILAPAVGSLTTASTGTSQGPSTSTIPGTRESHREGWRGENNPAIVGASNEHVV